MTFPQVRNCVLVCLLCLPSWLASAADKGGQFVRQGNFEVHYAAFNSMDVPPEVATALGVKRSGQRGVLVINARAYDDDGISHSVRASAKGRISNLVGQNKAFAPRLVEDGDVWYVLSGFSITEGERLRFVLEVTPEGSDMAVPIEFRQAFYIAE